MSTFVFVYGTLRKHERNHHILNNSTCKTLQASVKGTLFDTGNNNPALVVEDANRSVYGEVYEVDTKTLQQLDELEGYEMNRNSNLFNRISLEITTDQGNFIGYTYVAGALCDVKEVIELGDWRIDQYLKRQPSHVYYFAYGSCMDQERFELAKVDHLFRKEIGAGSLEGFSMKYTHIVHDGGRADIVEDGNSMEGILYECPAEAIDYLFKREGVYSQSYRPTLVDVTVGEKVYHSCLTFIVVHKQEETAPPVHYAKEILRGSQGKVSEQYYSRLISQLKLLQFDISHQEMSPFINKK